jgi:predicted Rdx family selenoprotein
MVPGRSGQFDVLADGEIVYSKQRTGRFPEIAEVISALPTLGAP